MLQSRLQTFRPFRAATHQRRLVVAKSAANKVDAKQLLDVAKKAAEKGAEVVLAGANKAKQITRKEGNDVVTDTDHAAEAVITQVIRDAFPAHAILGEEGGVLGDVRSEYLWCLDPLDGTINFSTGYPSFCVSVGVLRHATPVAGCVIEFIGGGPGGVGDWKTRTFTAYRNGGAYLDGKPLCVSRTKELRDAVVATEAVYYEEQWDGLSKLYKAFTKDARGVRMSGAAAANCCHLAMGVIDAYWQYNLKPWDMAAGALILEEAGGRITTTDGLAWSVFDRSMLATNDALYEKVLAVTEPATAKMRSAGADLGTWCVPKGYRVRGGAQLD
uniref:Inositol-1-monophosphatase n=1 Tax=Chlamydomonas leiostraca TaxID=1034604 RepID=A0A7S0RNB6_9CHLO|mmetsp:Transcript_27501/g.69995  ORF Transcript_27501/g.69995 Transcript_27501/m.69995 type:complete len:329 (+) Transcript_27501:20-1006(+)